VRGAAPNLFASVNGLSWQNGFGQAGGFNWRSAAIFTNWLNYGRAVTREAFLSGGYDVSTFGSSGGVFTDQLSASAGARFRLPTMDEWMMAGFYDAGSAPTPPQAGQPAEPGPGLWWHWNTNDAVPQPGVTTITGTSQRGLGLYPNAQSPWGLMDMSGGRSEWLEDASIRGNFGHRLIAGSGPSTNDLYSDSVTRHASTGELPWIGGASGGIRVVMVVPSPSVFGVMYLGLLTFNKRVRRGS